MEKSTVKLSLSTFLLIIAIIFIIIMTIFIFLQQSNSRNQISKLENDANHLQNTIYNLQNQIDQISNPLNSSISSKNSVINNQNMSTSNSDTITEKQTLEGNGYMITLYSNNEVKITPIIEDLQLTLGNIHLPNTDKTYLVTGFSGEIEKMYQGNNGSGVDPITFFIMKDGTVQYALPLTQIINNNNIIPNSFKIDGTIENLNNVVDLKTNSADIIIAITKDGKEIKCWNEI